jgi:cell division septum initiation protein DivIVA
MEQVAVESPERGQPQPAAEPRPPRPDTVSPRELRESSLPPVRRGYRREEVDELRERAARTIEILARRLKETLTELETARQNHAEPLIGRMLETANKLVVSVQNEAAEEADRLRAAARTDAEQARKLYEKADEILADARVSAVAIVDEARVERERVLRDSVAEVAKARAQLEAEKARIEGEIEELRSGWEASLREALRRVDAVRSSLAESEQQEGEVEAQEPPAQIGGRMEDLLARTVGLAADPVHVDSEAGQWGASESHDADGVGADVEVPVHEALEVLAELEARLAAALGSEPSEQIQ